MQVFISVFRWFYDISRVLIGPRLVKVDIKDILIDEKFNVRIYNSDNLKTKQVLVYYHGGGWIAGSIKAYDRILRYVSHKANCICIAVDYRKAPENKFPTPLNDVFRGYQWIIENHKKFNGDINNIILCGDSAGGNLILSLYNNMLSKTDARPKNLILIYPLLETNITRDPDATFFKKVIHYVSQTVLNFFKNQYIDKDTSDDSPYISLLKHEYKCDFDCNIFIITAEYDALTYGINIFSEKLIKQNTKITLKQYDKVVHGFMNFTAISIKAQKALDDIVDYILVNSSNIE